MKKARELRQYLADHVRDLAANPDRLIIYIPKGGIACRAGSLSFEWRYDVEITVTDFADHPDTLLIPVLAWLSINQPDLFQNPDTNGNVVRIEAEVIDHEKSDVQLTVTLTERVVVREQDGAWTATHCAEPALDDLGGTTRWSLFVNGVELVPGVGLVL